MSDGGASGDEPIVIPIDGTLDLHTFAPSEMSDVVREYLRAAVEEGLTEVRIVHGKGTGTLKRGVRTLLDKLDCVASYSEGGPGRGDWGATLVTLRKTEDADG